MRADRLVAVLLMLQRRGHVTAAAVAAELEVSERTARRDLDALAIAGLPVYSTQGRGGGWRLAGGGRTDLSGLSAPEVRALFLAAGPRATSSSTARAALRKLVRALPEALRATAETATSTLVIDPDAWGRRLAGATRPDPPLLDEMQTIVVNACQAEIDYVDRGGRPTTRRVHPLGIVAKGGTWYVVTETDAGRRTFRVDRIQAVRPSTDPAQRPEGFDLDAVWQEIVDEIDERRYPAVAHGLVDRDFLPMLRWVLGQRVNVGAAQPDGRVGVTVRTPNLRSLARETAGMAGLLEYTDPPALLAELLLIGQRLVEDYGSENGAAAVIVEDE